MTLLRRNLLGLLGAGAAGGALSKPAVAGSAARAVAFRHGVASGDPRSDGLIIWTRVSPADADLGTVDVHWTVWTQGAPQPAAHGIFSTGPERDFTVKVDVAGLQPGLDYLYEFAVGPTRSPQGRARTLPVGPTHDLALAVVSCQLYPGGLFNAYDAIAKLERLDAVVHLGDYIYEYGADSDAYGMATGTRLGRVPEPAHEILSLADYRTRHAQYKSDPDLQAAHARAPFICVWDDHEVANDTWRLGAENHDPATEGAFSSRKAAALKAYFEWMPIRDPQAPLTVEDIYRSFDFGDLATLVMMETRLLGRGEALEFDRDMPLVDGRPDVAAFRSRLAQADRDLIDDRQRDWIRSTLAASKSAGMPWQVIGNQVVMARVQGPDITRMASPLEISILMARLPAEIRDTVRATMELFKLGVPFNLDSWDGYPAARERLYAAFAEAGVQPIVLAGDSHAFWVNDLKDASGDRRAVEFATSAVSSPSPGDAVSGLPLGQALNAANDEVVFCDQSAKGFILLKLNREEAAAELHAVSTIFAKPYESRVLKTFVTRRGPGGLSEPADLTSSVGPR